MKARVNSDFGSMLNMRTKADVSSAVVERINVGTIVEVKKRNKEWSTVSHNGKVGYIMNRFLIFGEKDE